MMCVDCDRLVRLGVFVSPPDLTKMRCWPCHLLIEDGEQE